MSVFPKISLKIQLNFPVKPVECCEGDGKKHLFASNYFLYLSKVQTSKMSSSLKRKNTEEMVTRSRSKKQKMIDAQIQRKEPEQEPSIPVTKEKISKLSDLNEDCQIEIFRHFSIDDLVNVVEYDKKLSAAARWVYRQKTQNQFVCFSNEVDPERCNVPTTQVKMLNRFGADIDGVKLVYDDDYRRFDHIIEKAINNRCHKTLKSLRIENVGRYSLFDIKKPFKNVRKLQFSGGTLNYLIPKIGKWFPNANKLRISNFMIPQKNTEKLTPKHYHALRELQIRSYPILESSYARWATDFVVMNPQLTKLSVTYNTEMMTLLSMRKPVLSALHLEIIPSRFHDNSMVHFEKLKKLTFRGQVSRINVTAGEIGTMDINLRCFMNSDLYDLVRSGASINRLNIIQKWYADSNPNEIIERVKYVANLKELTFPADDYISTEEIVDLVGHCKTLKWILIHADKEMPEFPGIEEKLGTEWVVRRRRAIINMVAKFGFEFQKM